MHRSALRFTLALVLLLALLAIHPVPSAAQTTTLTGWFHVLWGDGPPGSRVALPPRYMLVDGIQATLLTLDERLIQPLGGSRALDRRRVRVTGRLSVAPAQRLDVQAIQLEQPAEPRAPEAIAGPQPWVNILCRFADATGVTPRDPSYVVSLMGSTYPGLDHYWREVSYSTVNLTGTSVVGWYNLPQARSYYVPGGSADLQRLVTDCTAVADADVFFPDFVGINLMFNQNLDCCAWGGSWTLNRDGQTRTYRVTWLPPWGYQNQGVVAHEMGHGFGMPHSSGPYAATYDSRWDVMSDLWGNCPPNDPSYGCIGVQTITYHKDITAWIGARKYVPAWGARATVFLERSALPPTATGYLMVQFPFVGSSTRFYTVEARRRVGYDTTLPGDAVILHLVDTTRGDRRAQVVDPDGNGNPDDAAAMWTPGETFTDKGRGVRVNVLSADATGFTTIVAYGPGDDTAGAYNPATGTFYLRNANTAGAADLAFQYGPAGAGFMALVGDWNGDGADTVGVYNPATGVFYLRNSNSAGPADLTFQYGPAAAGFIPLVGDWNGDSVDTVGVYSPATGVFYLRNTNSAGAADLAFQYGPGGAGFVPLVGDWDGDGSDTAGVYNPATGVFFLRNTNSAGSADLAIPYGPAGAGFQPVVGDWNGDLTITVGVHDPAAGVYYLRNSNTAGPADVVFGYGPGGAGFIPRLGDWDDR